MRWFASSVVVLILGAVLVARADAQGSTPSCPALTPPRQAALQAQHLFGGSPSPGASLLVRRAYLTEYDSQRRMPRWTAWQATVDYLGTPDRSVGRWGDYLRDPTVPNGVTHADYTNVGSQNMARGHLVPYFIAGGDRDGNGMRAAHPDHTLWDLDDACTIYEVNYTTNLTPQRHQGFNENGLWDDLETIIREGFLRRDQLELHLIAGPIYLDDHAPRTVGNGGLPVPHLFFQILIVTDIGVVPFLFDHGEVPGGTAGCPLQPRNLEGCIRSIAEIEALTGLDFFAGVGSEFEAVLEAPTEVAVWRVLTGP